MGETTGTGHSVRQVHYVTNFVCDARRCIDSCCKCYEIVKVEDYLVDGYRTHAPNLLQHVRKEENGWVMNVDGNRTCSACIDDLCQVQVECGPTFLPEICHSYPRRLTRLFGEVFITGNLPCNLMVESVLYGDTPFGWDTVNVERLPSNLANTREADFGGHSAAELFDIHAHVMCLADNDSYTSEELLLRLLTLAGLLDGLRRSDWSYMIKGVVRTAAREHAIDHLSRLGGMKAGPEDTVHDLLYAVLTVVKHRDHGKISKLLREVAAMVDGHTPAALREKWGQCSASTPIEGVLKRYLQARLVENLFPIANWGDCVDDMAFIALCHTVLRLCLLARHEQLAGFTKVDEIVEIVTIVEKWYYGRRKELYSQIIKMGWTSAEAVQVALVRW